MLCLEVATRTSMPASSSSLSSCLASNGMGLLRADSVTAMVVVSSERFVSGAPAEMADARMGLVPETEYSAEGRGTASRQQPVSRTGRGSCQICLYGRHHRAASG